MMTPAVQPSLPTAAEIQWTKQAFVDDAVRTRSISLWFIILPLSPDGATVCLL